MAVREAMFYEAGEGGVVICGLCAHDCRLKEKQFGLCGVRQNQGGQLVTWVYGLAMACQADPIEKKPLFHVAPGSRSLSLATVGCNFRCRFCQNWMISQRPKGPERAIEGEVLEPAEVVAAAQRAGCRSLSFTYTEPTVFFEYAYETARLAHEAGLDNVFVTNGYLRAEPLDTIRPYLTAANVDLKSFNPETYRTLIGARLEPVLETLRRMKDLGIWVEVTTLVIPTVNDSEAEWRHIADFIAHDLGPETPWHLSRFYPDYQLAHLPPTPPETLRRAREIGKEAGLGYVYSGNRPGDEGEHTFCSACGTLLIRRCGFEVLENRLHQGGCPECGQPMAGVGLAEKPAGGW